MFETLGTPAALETASIAAMQLTHSYVAHAANPADPVSSTDDAGAHSSLRLWTDDKLETLGFSLRSRLCRMQRCCRRGGASSVFLSHCRQYQGAFVIMPLSGRQAREARHFAGARGRAARSDAADVAAPSGCSPPTEGRCRGAFVVTPVSGRQARIARKLTGARCCADRSYAADAAEPRGYSGLVDGKAGAHSSSRLRMNDIFEKFGNSPALEAASIAAYLPARRRFQAPPSHQGTTPARTCCHAGQRTALSSRSAPRLPSGPYRSQQCR
jgi:hypothetical protein